MGIGADLWGRHTLRNGLIFAAFIVPIFIYRHYWHDKGVFPVHLDGGATLETDSRVRAKAGFWPLLAVAVGCIVVWIAHSLSRLPVP